MNATIVILDYGSQYTQLIARRLREERVYCEIFPWQTPEEQIMALQPRGFILSGGPSSVYEENAPRLPDYVLKVGVPVLGICYGMQLLVHSLGGEVAPCAQREYGSVTVEVAQGTRLLPRGRYPVWMSHGDRVEALPAGCSSTLRCSIRPSAVKY